MKLKTCIKCCEDKPEEKFVLRKDTGKRKNTCNLCNYKMQTKRDIKNFHLKKETRTHNTCIHCEKTKPIGMFQPGFKTPIRKNICNRCHFEKHDRPQTRRYSNKKYMSSERGKQVAVKAMRKYKTLNRDKYLLSQRKHTKKAVDNLSDSYIIESLKAKGWKYPAEWFYQNKSIISAQRAMLKLKRKANGKNEN